MPNFGVGLIGAGVFGGYHASKIAASARTAFTGVFDPDPVRASELAERHDVRRFESQDALLEACDAVIIACPATYHETLTEAALSRDCHVMVEKPLALTGKAAAKLAEAAKTAGLVLQVGHQERFFLDAMGLFDIDEAPTRIEAWRMGPPAPDGRAGDVSVIWDLMIHDLDMAARLMGTSEAVEASGRSAHTDHIDEASTRIDFGSGVARLHASRCAPARDRRMELTYPSGTISIDFLTRNVSNSTPHSVRADVSDLVPDPLGAADEAFFAACLGERACAIPGHQAAEAVALAEQAELSVLHTIGV